MLRNKGIKIARLWYMVLKDEGSGPDMPPLHPAVLQLCLQEESALGGSFQDCSRRAHGAQKSNVRWLGKR